MCKFGKYYLLFLWMSSFIIGIVFFSGCIRNPRVQSSQNRNATKKNNNSTNRNHSRNRSNSKQPVVKTKVDTVYRDRVDTVYSERVDTIYMVVPTTPENDGVIVQNDGDVIIPTNKKLKPIVRNSSWPTPPKIEFKRPSKIHSRYEYIEYYDITGEMKELIVACDYDSPTVRNNSAALVSESPGSFNIGQICDIFDFCYTNWSYINDPMTSDYFSKASETLRNGLNGDCDDFAILVCSMIISIGGEARINFAYDDNSGHAFTEVNIGSKNRNEVSKYIRARYGHSEMWHREDGSGNWWLNLDWQGNHPGAKYWSYDRGSCFNIIRNEKTNL